VDQAGGARLALHRAGQATAERLRRELHRPAAGRAPERGDLRKPRSRPPRARALAARLQPSSVALGACRDAAGPRAAARRGRPARTRCWSGRTPARTEPHHLLSIRRTPLMTEGRQGSRSAKLPKKGTARQTGRSRWTLPASGLLLEDKRRSHRRMIRLAERIHSLDKPASSKSSPALASISQLSSSAFSAARVLKATPIATRSSGREVSHPVAAV
jgi:hypothetical protein